MQNADYWCTCCAQDNEARLSHMGTAPHRHGVDAFSAAAARVQHQEQAGRWGQHMATRMSRSLAEGDTSATGGPLKLQQR